MEEIYNPKENPFQITSILDLDRTLQNYIGHTKFNRLAQWSHIPSLKKDAHDLLIIELLKSNNTALFRKLTEERELTENNNLFDEWFSTTEKNLTTTLSILENELLTAKSTTVKESIRLAYCELGNLYYKWGKFDEAFKSFLRSRDYCSLPKHHNDIAYQLILLSFDMKQYYNANNFVNKLFDLSTDIQMLTKAKVIQGLLLILNENSFHNAVNKFLEISTELPNDELNSFISIYDVGFYVFILGLSTMNYQELKTKIFGNRLFMNYYLSGASATGNNNNTSFSDPVKGTPTAAPEIASSAASSTAAGTGAGTTGTTTPPVYNPYNSLKLKQLLTDVMNNNFTSIFNTLPQIYQFLCMDMYLSKYANLLMKLLIEKLLLQYINPYQILSLEKILETFPSFHSLTNLKNILISLISKNKLNYKINSIHNILLKNEIDPEKQMFMKLFQLITKNSYQLKRGFLRTSLMKNQFLIDPEQGENLGGNSFGGKARKLQDLHDVMRNRRNHSSSSKRQQRHAIQSSSQGAVVSGNGGNTEDDLSDHEMDDMDDETMMMIAQSESAMYGTGPGRDDANLLNEGKIHEQFLN